MKRPYPVLFVLVIAAVLLSANSSEAIYKWVDKKGHIHITDSPPPEPQPAEKEEKTSQANAAETKAPVITFDQEMLQPAAAPQPTKPEPVPQAAASTQTPAGTQAKNPPGLSSSPMPGQAGKQAIPSAAPGNTGQVVLTIPASQIPGMQIPSMQGKGPSPEMIRALAATFATVFMVVGAAIYLFSALCLFLIAKKLDVPGAWTAWIPILQIWAFFRSAGKSLWWILLFFIPIVNVIVGIYLWMCIAENLGKNKWLGLLTLIPLVNFILMAVLAFSSKEGMGSPRLAPARA